MKKEKGINFYERIPNSQMLDKWYRKSGSGIMVLDDLMNEVTTKEFWTFLPKMLIIEISQSSTCVKICFPKENSSRPILELRITLLPLKIPASNWEYAISRNKPFRRNSKRY